jgi:hypothetical protein
MLDCRLVHYNIPAKYCVLMRVGIWQAVRVERQKVRETEGLLPEPAVARIVYECLRLCEATHKRNFVHLDIKPVGVPLAGACGGEVGL